MALPSALSFISGSSQGGQPSNPTLTPEAIERRQALAAALIKQGMDYSPIQSPWQGVARVTDAIAGPIEQHWADQDAYNSMKAGADQMTGFYQSLLGGQGGATGGPTGTGASAAPTPGGAATDGSSSNIGTDLPPDGLQKHAFDYFVAQGYTPAAAAGLVGNFQQESGFSPSNIAAVSGGGDGGVSKHLAQWNGDRLTGLNDFAAKMGKSPSDYDTQLAYVNWELNNTEKATGNALKGVTDPQQAAIIAAGYERPQGWTEYQKTGNPRFINGWNNRLGSSVSAFNQYGGAGSSPTVAQASPSPQAPGQPIVTVDPLPPGSQRQDLDLPGQQAPSNQVASADPSFVPPIAQTGLPQQANALPPPILPNAAVPPPDMAFSTVGAGVAGPGAIPAPLPADGTVVQGNPANPQGLQAALAAKAAQMQAPSGVQPMTGANAAPQMAALGLQPMPDINGASAGPSAAAPPPEMAFSQPMGAPSASQVPQSAPGPQQFAPGSLTGAQAEALANQGIRVPQSAVAMPPMPDDNGAPIPPSAGGPQAALAPPVTRAPASGAAGVTAALAAPSPVPAAAPAPNLSPGGQQVAQALMPQGQQGLPPGLDMAKVSAIMANPWIPESQKQMLNGMIMQRFQPHELKPVPTTGGTLLLDGITGQQRGFIPTANNTALENPDGTKTIINMNDPAAIAAYNQRMGQPGGAGLAPGQKTPMQLFPGAKPTNEQIDYTGVYNDAVAKGQQPPSYNDWSLDQKKAGSNSVTIAGETEESKALGAARAKNIVGYMDAAQDARTKLQALQLMSEAFKTGNGNISTGPGAEMILNAKEALGNALGVNLDGTAPSEVVKKLGAQLAAAAAKSLAARPTQFDFKTFLANNPGLEISPQGNALMINIMSQQAQHEMELGRIAQSYKGSTADWNDVVADYDKKNPILSPFTGKPLGADQKMFDDPNKAPTPSPKTEEEYNQLPSGTQFIAPDGVTRIKP